MKAGDLIRVQGVAYRTPPAASRESMNLMRLDAKAEDTKVARRIKKLKESASGFVDRSAYGVVRLIRDDMVVFKNLADDKIEHATAKDCQIIQHGDLPKAMGRRIPDRGGAGISLIHWLEPT